MTDNEDKKFQIQEYNILVDLIKHQHTRIHDFNKTILTVNTILVGACAILLKEGNPGLHYYLIPLCGLGFAISLFWLFVLQRMKVDTDLRWSQLRNRERLLSRPKGIFSEGYEYFERIKEYKFFESIKEHKSFKKKKNLDSSDKKENSDLPHGIWLLFTKIKVVWALKIISLLFMCLYVVLIVYVILIVYVVCN